MNRLITIPFSHFCEKARWALERAGVPFREDGYLPMLQMLPAWRAGGKRTVPVLVTEAGAVTDSTEILRWCDQHGQAAPLFPDGDLGREVAALEERLDKGLGPATRRVAYHQLLPMPGAARLLAEKAPARWQGRVMRAAYPLARAAMTRGLRLDDASAERSRGRIDEIFADVGAMVFTAWMNFSGSFSFTSMSNTSMPEYILKSSPFPSITGLPAKAPMSPNPRTAVPLDITATRLPLAV